MSRSEHNSVDERMAWSRPASLGLEGTPSHVAANEGKLEACLTGWGSITRAHVRRTGSQACPRLWALDRGNTCRTYSTYAIPEISTYVGGGADRRRARSLCARWISRARLLRRGRAGEAGNVSHGAILTTFPVLPGAVLSQLWKSPALPAAAIT